MSNYEHIYHGCLKKSLSDNFHLSLSSQCWHVLVDFFILFEIFQVFDIMNDSGCILDIFVLWYETLNLIYILVVLACFLWYWSVKAGDSTFFLPSEDGRPDSSPSITDSWVGLGAPHHCWEDGSSSSPHGLHRHCRWGHISGCGDESPLLAFSDTTPARSASLPALRGWKSRLPMRTLLARVAVGHSFFCGVLAIVEQFRVGEFSVLLGCLVWFC